MKRTDEHINKFLRDPLPDPEIPADEAWADMRDMLDETTGPAMNGPLSRIWQSLGKFKGLLIGTSVFLTSAVISLIVVNTETKTRKPVDNQSISNIQDNSKVKSGLKTKTLMSPDAPVGIGSTSPSETAATDTAGAGTAVPETATPNTTRLKKTRNGDISTKNPAAISIAANRAIPENERIDDHADHSITRSGTSHSRTNSAEARTARPRGVPGHAGTNANGREVFTWQAAQETAASFSHEKNTSATPVPILVSNLKPLAGRFDNGKNDLSRRVQSPEWKTASLPSGRSASAFWQSIHFGPEWNISRSIVSTDYMFTGTDSVKRPARLAIPGVFVSKSWNRHSVTFIFNPLHAYFGDKERVAQRADTIRVTDSLFHLVDRNVNFVKASGINFSLQYQYRAISLFSLVGGLSYAGYSSALFRKEIEYTPGFVVNDGHLTIRGKEALKSYIRPQQWNIRAGMLFHSPDVFNNRLQFAWMTIIPVSNLSLNGFKSVRSPNMQLSLRFLVK